MQLYIVTIPHMGNNVNEISACFEKFWFAILEEFVVEILAI